MKIVPVDQIQPGMILAKPICSEKDGLVLLQAKKELKQAHIEKIKELEYDYLYL
ncbi:MAG: hypothetical protein ACM3X9_13905 [Bacillota bacterium]